MAQTECCSLQKAAELCACYLRLLCSFRLGTSFPLFPCQLKARNEWVLLKLKIYSQPIISGLYISCKKNFYSNSTFLWESSTSPEWLPNSLNVAAGGSNVVFVKTQLGDDFCHEHLSPVNCFCACSAPVGMVRIWSHTVGGSLVAPSIVVQRWLQPHFGNLDKRVANTRAAVVCSGLPSVT